MASAADIAAGRLAARSERWGRARAGERGARPAVGRGAASGRARRMQSSEGGESRASGRQGLAWLSNPRRRQGVIRLPIQLPAGAKTEMEGAPCPMVQPSAAASRLPPAGFRAGRPPLALAPCISFDQDQGLGSSMLIHITRHPQACSLPGLATCWLSSSQCITWTKWSAGTRAGHLARRLCSRRRWPQHHHGGARCATARG